MPMTKMMMMVLMPIVASRLMVLISRITALHSADRSSCCLWRWWSPNISWTTAADDDDDDADAAADDDADGDHDDYHGDDNHYDG